MEIEISEIHCLSPQWHIYVDRYFKGTVVRVGDAYGVFYAGKVIGEFATMEEVREAVRREVERGTAVSAPR